MVGVYKAKRALGHKAQTQILTPDQPSIITSSVSVMLHASMTTHTYTKSHCSYTSNGVLVCKPFVASTVMCKAGADGDIWVVVSWGECSVSHLTLDESKEGWKDAWISFVKPCSHWQWFYYWRSPSRCWSLVCFCRVGWMPKHDWWAVYWKCWEFYGKEVEG